jgi:hypothetical protein
MSDRIANETLHPGVLEQFAEEWSEAERIRGEIAPAFGWASSLVPSEVR